ncbi:MAG: amidohydrolase family protein [Proteobacteria bacterium]|nr:amidohydrolase family protein [Pseudomonadota bacterium]
MVKIARSAWRHLHSHGATNSSCCALHMLTGCLDGTASSLNEVFSQVGDATSFVDRTPKTPSAFCVSDTQATAGLYETLDASRPLVIRNVRIITMVEHTILTSHDVTVRGGRIESIMPTGQKLPDNAIVIEAAGKTLLPGLSDVHGHPFVANWGRHFASFLEGAGDGVQFVLPYDLQMFLQVACGITRLEILAGCADALWLREAIRAGTLIGPRLSVGSPLIDGNPPVHAQSMSYMVGDREGGVRAGNEIADRGFDFAKPYTRLPADGFDGLMDACAQRGLRVMGHVPVAVGVEGAIRRGQLGIAHAAELFLKCEEPERSDRKRRDRIIRLMADTGVWLQATVCVIRRMEWIDTGGPYAPPDMDYLNPVLAAFWAEAGPVVSARRAQAMSMFTNSYASTCEWTNAARAAGVRILTGTDFMNPYVVEGFSLHEELDRLVRDCGFDPHDALFGSTRLGADYHDEAAIEGTVSVGARSDLLLLNSDPLSDIRATRDIDAVIVGRHLLRADGIAEGLRRVREAYTRMPVVEPE